MTVVAVAVSPMLEAATISFTIGSPFALAAGTSGIFNPYPSSVAVGGLTGVVRRVSVTLNNFTHTFPDDVDVLLVGPTGARIVVMSDVGGGDDVSNITITFSDKATQAAPDNALLSTGTYLPSSVDANDPFIAPAPPGPYAHPAPAGAATFASVFAGSNPNGVWSLYVVDDAGQDVGTISGGWTLTLTLGGGFVDFDGDLKTDDAVVRGAPSQLIWFTNNSAGFQAIGWGNPAVHEWAFTGDYDGDSRSDHAVWDQDTGIFAVRQSSNGGLLAQQWGQAGDFPLVAGDYDGDGRTDFAVWRPSTGRWWIRRSTNGTIGGQVFGTIGDFPITGDYDGDGIADLAIRRTGGGLSTFHLLKSNGSVYQVIQWGLDTDQAAPGDYDGDGLTDVAVIRRTPTSISYFIRQSSTGTLLTRTWRAIGGDQPVPGDYDGDDVTDVAMFRTFIPGQTAFISLSSRDGGLRFQPWGLTGDYPVPLWIVR